MTAIPTHTPGQSEWRSLRRSLGRPLRLSAGFALLCAAAAIAQGETAGPVETQTDVFVAGTDGYHTYRIPAIMAAPDGTLLAFCEGRRDSAADSGNIDLLLKRSADGGRSWGPSQVLWDDGGNTCGNPCPVVDADTGTIWLLASHNPGSDREKTTMRGNGSGGRTVWVLRSADNGRHWSAPTEITSTTKAPDWDWYATGPGIGIQIQHGPHAGRLVIPCDHSKRSPDGTVQREAHVIFSDDHGRSWRPGGTIEPAVNECQVVELAHPAGALLIDLRSYAGHHCRAEASSLDGGESWTSAHAVAALIDPVCQASLIRSPAGVLLFSNPADPRRRVRLTVRSSHDDGRTWPESRVLHAGPAAYSCLIALGDGDAGCLFECGEKGPYERISFTRFRLRASR